MTWLAAIDVDDQVAGLSLVLFTRLRDAAAAGGGSACAAAAARAGRMHELLAPVPAEHRQLLESIAVNVTPAAQMSAPDATISDLCAGIIAARSALTRPAGNSPPGLRGLRSSPQTRCALPQRTTSWSASTLKPCTGYWRCGSPARLSRPRSRPGHRRRSRLRQPPCLAGRQPRLGQHGHRHQGLPVPPGR